ncbi:MAG: ferredoxin-thioredoxin reductase catalytic domain-containing protein [Dehalococcoidia bacterium]
MPLDEPTDADRERATNASLQRMWRYVRAFAEKSGTSLHPHPEITEFLVIGLARHIDQLGRPLCPCNFYEDKSQEARSSEWICACDEMQRYKYCHCMLFVNQEGLPITEYLPGGHEGREAYGIVPDPDPTRGRALGRLEARRGHELHKGRAE